MVLKQSQDRRQGSRSMRQVCLRSSTRLCGGSRVMHQSFAGAARADWADSRQQQKCSTAHVCGLTVAPSLQEAGQ